MKKVVLYCVAAVVLGTLLVLGPLMAFAIFENERNSAALYLKSAPEQLPEIERTTYGSNVSSYSSLDIGILAACFISALTVYLFARHRISL
ncbi:MAG: hypothetical protein ACP5IM_07660 [Candidatus Bathyarchaeia archaeon]